MIFKNIEELTNSINERLFKEDFCAEFQFKRKELFQLGKVANTTRLFEFKDPNREWVINAGGGTELQYHLFFRDKKVGYGLGFNTQYVPFANKKTPVEYMKPFAESFLSQPKLQSELFHNGFKYIYGDENALRELPNDEYILIGKEINVSENAGKFEIPDELYETLLNDLKGILFKTYESIILKLKSTKKYKYSLIEFEKLFKDYLAMAKPNSANTYLNAIITVNDIGLSNSFIKESLYEIQDSNSYNDFIDKLNHTDEYLKKNEIGHNRYSSALTWYKKFLEKISQGSTYFQTNIKQNNMNLNTILFGPPGTGKTFNTVNTALDILEEDTTDFSRSEVKSVFNEYLNSGNIVFSTFHQSMAYEDFIEGIKPKIKGDKVVYEIVDGIFKQLSTKALKSILHNKNKKNKGNNQDFESIYAQFVSSLKKYLNKDEFPFKSMHGSELKLISIKGNSIVVQYRYSNNSTKTEAGTNEFNISKDKLRLLFENNVSIDDNIPLTVKFKPFFNYNKSVYYSVYKKFKEFIVSNLGLNEDYIENIEAPSTFSDLYEEWSELSLNEKEKLINENKNNFVLIIDEINRGNVSQIFGELITLIEHDKRLGMSEALEVILPYSKEKFSVPPNLYIIGTMNTADRSVEALDTALRRRFSFKEMAPQEWFLNPTRMYWKLLDDYTQVGWNDKVFIEKEKLLLELIGSPKSLYDAVPEIWQKASDWESFQKAVSNYTLTGYNLEKILFTINARLEKLLGKDHKIGHSFFINVKSVDELKEVFMDKLIPLLQEYFYGDFGKIGLVLGKGFVEITDNKSDIFANFDYDSEALNERIIYELVDFTIKDKKHSIKVKDTTIEIDFEMAIKLLLNNNID